MDERRALLNALALRLLAAAPFAAAAWWLFASSAGDPDGATQRVAALACIVVAGIIVAPALAGLLAEPAGSLFHPRRFGVPEPGYDAAEAHRRQGRYADAQAAYERVLAQFPADLPGWIGLLEVTALDLHDGAAAERVAHRALVALPDTARRHEFLRARRAVLARLRGSGLEGAATAASHPMAARR